MSASRAGPPVRRVGRRPTGGAGRATSALITHLREDVVPAADRGSGLTVYVGGATAASGDLAALLAGKLPLFLGVIVALGCLLLMVAFRSVLVPLTAAVMNLAGSGTRGGDGCGSGRPARAWCGRFPAPAARLG
ncbi:MMPL family transporter [Streptomyces mirabilis]|uniref:MMPL family transporter n=1 Tax=Streptomyces mirabilis TaxID=68239 RepID=UPI0036746BE9